MLGLTIGLVPGRKIYNSWSGAVYGDEGKDVKFVAGVKAAEAMETQTWVRVQRARWISALGWSCDKRSRLGGDGVLSA